MGVVEAAWGVAEVVDENMANAARVHAVENGEDLSEYTMIAFGGAAPLHAGRLCEKLGIDRCLIPVGAGVGSAIGFLRASFSFEANRSVFMRISALDAKKVKSLFIELEKEARGFVRSCDAKAKILTEYKIYMRYSGQGWEIPIRLKPSQVVKPDAATYLKLFEAEYSKLFGRSVEGMEAEITVWSANAFTPVAKVKAITRAKPKKAAKSLGKRKLFDPGLGKMTQAAIALRENFATGSYIEGPAIVTEDETTVIVPTARRLIAQADGCLDMVLKEKKRG